MLSCEFCETFKNIYFANLCEGLFLKSKILTGVSFLKILDFYYKRNRRLYFYEGTSSYILLKISERVNRIIFSGFLWVIASENTLADKNMLRVDKEMFQECYLGILLAWNIFEVCNGVWLS